MILKMCRRCKGVVVYPATYCDACKELVDKEREERAVVVNKKAQKKYDAKRDKKYVRFYNSPEWRMLKARYMQDKGYRCERCRGIATEVHHVEPIQTEQGWVRRLDYTNLLNVCTRCHNKEHGRFGG